MQQSTESPIAIMPRACTCCARAKVRCLPPTDDTARCARCSRLNKDCMKTAKLKRKRRSPTANTKTAVLEQKIESLVNLLSAKVQTEITPQSDYLTPPETHDSNDFLPGRERPIIQNNTGIALLPSHVTETPAQPVRLPSTTNSHLLCSSGTAASLQVTEPVGFAAGNSPYPEQPNRLLCIFREQFAPQFPFVHIPQAATAEGLRSQKPWLYKTVLMIAYYEDRVAQVEAAKEIILGITSNMLIRGDKNMDMLESLILYNAHQGQWLTFTMNSMVRHVIDMVLPARGFIPSDNIPLNRSFYYSPTTTLAQSSGVFQLTLAMLYDLGLHKPFRETESGGESEVMVVDIQHTVSDHKKESERPLCESRALITCFMLSTHAAHCNKKTERMAYTTYIDYICRDLADRAEDESDLVLVSIAKIHGMIELTKRDPRQHVTEEDARAPPWMHVKSVQASINTYWGTLPGTVQQNPILLSAYRDAQISIYDSCLTKYFFPTPTTPGVGNSQRIDMLYASLLAVKGPLDYYVSKSIAEFSRLSIMDIAHLGHSFRTLLRLSLVEEIGWDHKFVRQSANISDYFTQVMSKYEEVGRVLDKDQRPGCKESFPTCCCRALGRVQSLYEAKLAAETEKNIQLGQRADMPLGDMMNWERMAFDDAYWLELTGDSSFV